MQHQLGHHPVDGQIIQQGFLKPPAERSGVVQRGVEDVGIFREHIQPETDPVVCPTVIRKEPVNEAGAFIGGSIVEKGTGLVHGGDETDRVEGDPAEEGHVLDRRGDFLADERQFRPGRPFLDPMSQNGRLFCGQGLAFGGHDLVGIVCSNAVDHFAGPRLAGNDGRPAVASPECVRQGVQLQPSFGLLATMTIEAAAFDEGADIPEKVHRIRGRMMVLSFDLEKLGGQEMVDRTGCGEAFRQCRHFGFRGGRQPVGRHLTALLPNLSLLFPQRRPG